MTKIVYRKIRVGSLLTWEARCTFDCGIEYHATDPALNTLLIHTVARVLSNPCLEPC